MSSMRSASSSTTKRVWSSTIERSSIRSVSRPGVAIDHVDAAGHRPDLGACGTCRRAPAASRSRAPPAKAAEGRLDLHRELAGRRENQRPAGLGRGAAAGARAAGAGSAARTPPSCRCRSGRCRGCRARRAAVRSPAPGSASACRSRHGSAHRSSGSARPKSAKVVCRHSFSFPRGHAAAVCRPRQAHVTKTELSLAVPGSNNPTAPPPVRSQRPGCLHIARPCALQQGLSHGCRRRAQSDFGGSLPPALSTQRQEAETPWSTGGLTIEPERDCWSMRPIAPASAMP